MIKKLLFFFLFSLIQSVSVKAQVDYSDKWEDYFSYVNIKDFQKNGDVIRAIVDNSAFKYNTSTNEITKISSIQGLYNGATTAMHYSSQNSIFIIAYEDGIFELLYDDGTIVKIVDISISDVSPLKSINGIYEYENKIYLSMQFGIVVFDLLKVEFSDTYFIGQNSSTVNISSIVVNNGFIYAASDNGVYIADINSNLSDFENWNLNFSGAFKDLTVFNTDVLVSQDKTISKIVNKSSLELKVTMTESINDFNSDATNLIVGSNSKASIFSNDYSELHTITISSNNINSVFVEAQKVYLGTQKKGLMTTSFSNLSSFEEIHPKGPNSNDIFSISVHDNDLWMVYGGHDNSNLNWSAKKNLGITHYDGSVWTQIASSARDLSDVLIDTDGDNKAYVGSYFNGLVVVDNLEVTDVLTSTNDNVSGFAPFESISLINSSRFDSNGNLWIASSEAKNHELLNKLVDDSVVEQISFSSVVTSSSTADSRVFEIEVDRNDFIWLGTRGEGLLVTNGLSGENNKVAKIGTESSNGNLPSSRVKAVASDRNNNIWIGTPNGLVKFTDVSNVFSGSFDAPKPVVIVENGINEILLGESDVNTILVDGSDNKWFGTSAGGVIKTNPTGLKTLAKFNKENSPLPSDFIKKIKIDEVTGKVYFLTEKGIVSYQSDIAPYGEELTAVYGYPNPAYKHQHQISITGKDGANLPYGTNVKILDAAGNLVFESNTIESQSAIGGKIVWNKKNLSGNKVASGVYIVLLYNENGTQTSSTKIAIIN